jgi:hypothetical protein
MRAGDDVGKKEVGGGYGAAGERGILRSSQANRIQEIRLHAAGNTALPIGISPSLPPPPPHPPPTPPSLSRARALSLSVSLTPFSLVFVFCLSLSRARSLSNTDTDSDTDTDTDTDTGQLTGYNFSGFRDLDTRP